MNNLLDCIAETRAGYQHWTILLRLLQALLLLIFSRWVYRDEYNARVPSYLPPTFPRLPSASSTGLYVSFWGD